MHAAHPVVFDARHIFNTQLGPEQKTQTKKTYSQDFFSTLKHSNATQNIYFSNYIEWQGIMRERWFYDVIDQKLLSDIGVFVTKQVHQDYIKEGFPFQTITCKLNTFKIQKCSFFMMFRFFIGGELTSSGFQQVAFTNHQKKIARLPEAVLEKITQYEMQDYNG